MFEETILEKAIEATTAMTLNGDAEDIDLNEMKGTALISFAVGALMGVGDSDFKNSAWLVAAENPEEFKKALQAEVANGKKVDVEKMYNKALKIKGLSEIKEVKEEDIPKLDELTDLKDKAEKAKAIGADAQAKVFKEQAEAKEVEIFKEQEEEEIEIPEELPKMAATVYHMVQELLLCFLTDSASKAKEILASDNTVDYLHDVLSKRLLSNLGEQESAHAQMRAQFLFCSRFLERMGDACTSIAKRVYFLSTGERIFN